MTAHPMLTLAEAHTMLPGSTLVGDAALAFEKLAEAYLALWWLPAGRLPSVEEAEWRIGLMRQHGPTAEAFTFRSPFGPPAASRRRGPAIDAEFCWAG